MTHSACERHYLGYTRWHPAGTDLSRPNRGDQPIDRLLLHATRLPGRPFHSSRPVTPHPSRPLVQVSPALMTGANIKSP